MSSFCPAAAVHVDLVGHRVEHVEGLPADAVDELAVDEVLDLLGQVLGNVVRHVSGSFHR